MVSSIVILTSLVIINCVEEMKVIMMSGVGGCGKHAEMEGHCVTYPYR